MGVDYTLAAKNNTDKIFLAVFKIPQKNFQIFAPNLPRTADYQHVWLLMFIYDI